MTVSARTQYIFNKFYKERAKEKSRKIYEHYQCYYDAMDLPDACRYSLCETTIREAVFAYFLDVIKYKESHFSCDKAFPDEKVEHLHAIHAKMINLQKVTSLTAKWLLRMSPAFIEVKEGYTPTPDEAKIIHSANACCVLSHVDQLLDLNIDEEDTVCDDILYHFNFRQYDHRHFILIFDLLKRVA